MKAPTIALASPYHDPGGHLLTQLKTSAPLLKSIFDTVNVVMSDQTDKRTLDIMERAGIHFEFRIEDGNVGDRYRESLRLALEDNVDHIMLLDFDRALHWVGSFPDELEVTAEQIKNTEGFTSLVRSSRAFETHPLVQRQTEVIINQIASEAVGHEVDIVSGGYGMDQAVAKLLVIDSIKSDFGFYGEILALPLNAGYKINSIEVEGLEWETPDQYKEEIHKIGYTQWLNNFQSLEEWEKRLTLAFEAGKAIKD